MLYPWLWLMLACCGCWYPKLRLENAQVEFDRRGTPAGENELRCIGAAIWTSDTSAAAETASQRNSQLDDPLVLCVLIFPSYSLFFADPEWSRMIQRCIQIFFLAFEPRICWTAQGATCWWWPDLTASFRIPSRLLIAHLPQLGLTWRLIRRGKSWATRSGTTITCPAVPAQLCNGPILAGAMRARLATWVGFEMFQLLSTSFNFFQPIFQPSSVGNMWNNLEPVQSNRSGWLSGSGNVGFDEIPVTNSGEGTGFQNISDGASAFGFAVTWSNHVNPCQSMSIHVICKTQYSFLVILVATDQNSIEKLEKSLNRVNKNESDWRSWS